MTVSLTQLAREGKKIRALSDRELVQLQKWIDDDWESHDVDPEMIALVRRLLTTIHTGVRDV